MFINMLQKGKTALFIACSKNMSNIVQILLQNGADINAQNVVS